MESMICTSSLASSVRIHVLVGDSMDATALANCQMQARTSIAIDGWRLLDQVRKHHLATKMCEICMVFQSNAAFSKWPPAWVILIALNSFLEWSDGGRTHEQASWRQVSLSNFTPLELHALSSLYTYTRHNSWLEISCGVPVFPCLLHGLQRSGCNDEYETSIDGGKYIVVSNPSTQPLHK